MPNSLWWKKGDCLRLWQQVWWNWIDMLSFYFWIITFKCCLHQKYCVAGSPTFSCFLLFSTSSCVVCFILYSCLPVTHLWFSCDCVFNYIPWQANIVHFPTDSSVPDCCVCFQSHLPVCPVWGCASAWSEEEPRPGAHRCGHKAGGWLHQQDRRRLATTDLTLIFYWSLPHSRVNI